MRCLECNKRQMWLSRHERTELLDEDTGLGTGEYVDELSEPVSVRINAAPNVGTATPSPFGMDSSYDLTLVADGNPWGIREGDVMWLRDDRPDVSGASPDMAGAYTVNRVSPSINFCAFGLTRRQGR